MKNLLVFLFMSGFVGQVFGSEKSEEIIVFKAALTEFWNNPLRYCEKEYVDFLNNNYGIECAYNEPFIGVSYQQNSQNELIQRITFIPFKCFIDNSIKQHNNISSFKQFDAELLSCSNQGVAEKNKFRIELVTDFAKTTPQDLLNEFKERPQCALGNCFNKLNDIAAWMDISEVEKELCNAGIICKRGGVGGFIKFESQNGMARRWIHEYVQGINGYFGEEVKEEIRQDYEAMKTALFYSRIKKLFGASIAAIIAYVLYKKLYAAA